MHEIHLQLVAIDSMYSTNMSKHPYGLEGLARAIEHLMNGCDLTQAFRTFAVNPSDDNYKRFNLDSSFRQYQDERRINTNTNLWEYKFGVNKNKASVSRAISLISKYAYYLTDKQFPIYDDLARKMYRKICAYCGIERQKKIDNEISNFIIAINQLIDYIVENKRCASDYDVMDRILWIVEKLLSNRPALVLSMQEFALWNGKDFTCWNIDLSENDPRKCLVEFAESISQLENNRQRRSEKNKKQTYIDMFKKLSAEEMATALNILNSPS